MFDVEYKLQSLNRGTPGLIPAWTNGTFVSPVTGQPVAGTVTGGRITRLAKFNARGPDDKTRRKITTFDSRFEHRFNRVLSLRVNGQVYFGTYDSWSYGLYIPSYRMSDATLHGRRPLHEDHETASFSGQADLLAVFNTGPVAHKLLLTMDGRHESGPQPDWEMPDEVYEALPDSVRNLSVERPDWSSFDHSLLTKKVRDDETITKDLGFLLSERAALLRGRVLLYASLRNDNFRADFENKLNPSQSGGLRRSVFNHTLGGVAHIIPGRFIFFANRSTSFTPSSTLDRGTGELQEPLTSKGIEAGFRGEIMPASATDGWRGLYWAASIYRIDRKAPQSNPYYSIDGGLEAGIPQYINSAVERVDGIELELFGTISRHTTVSVAYTRLHPYVKNYPDDRAREGMPLRYMPDTTLAATTRYRFTDGLLKGVLLGAAMRYTEEFFAYYGTAGSQVTGTDTIGGNLRLNYGPADRIEEIRPAVTLFDVFAEYQFKTGKYTHIVGINLNNALNATYYGHNGNPGNEREILIRWRLKF
ncbi:MAG: TonB-dependent receptor [Opitutaceae bacterium]|nr:TonB-dependent receptor [Opitutaceae bacterium]